MRKSWIAGPEPASGDQLPEFKDTRGENSNHRRQGVWAQRYKAEMRTFRYLR